MNEQLKSKLMSIASYFSWIFDVILAIAFVSGLTHIPNHNIAFEPEFWYEVPIIAGYTWCITVTAYQILLFHHGIGLPYVKNWANFIIIYAYQVTMFVVTYILYYYIWVVRYKFYPPMPFSIPICPHITCTVTCVIQLVLVWIR